MAYLASSNPSIQRLTEKRIPVGWATVLAGLHPLQGRPWLTSAEVVDLAIEALARGEEPSPQLLGLAAANPFDDEEVTEGLHALVGSGPSQPDVEQRKWRLLEVEDLLATLPGDPLYALLALSDFWVSVGSPPDSPHTVQGVGENWLSPESYYTDGHYQQVMEDHRRWLAREREDLAGK
jgi:hypothetical protein